VEEAKKSAEEERNRMLQEAARRAEELRQAKKAQIDAAVEKCVKRFLQVEAVR